MVMFSKKNLRKRRRGLADFIPGFHGNILSNPHDNHDNHEPHHGPLSASVSSSTAAMASVSPSALVAAEIVAWRGPAEYPRRPRRVAQSGVSRPGLDPPRREVTPGTMEAAINLKIKRADARPPGIAFGFFGSSGCSEASGRRFGSRINPVRADRNSRLRRR